MAGIGEFEQPPPWKVQSAIPSGAWPAVPAPGGAAALAVLHQLESSQWLPAEQLLQLQLRQLEQLLRHAHATVAYYRECWDGRYDPSLALTPERFAELPLLARRDVQHHYETLKSHSLPAGHRVAGEARTSGSTGSPVRVLKTQLSNLFWNAFTLRDHLWHRRDLRRKLAVIRADAAAGEADTWGPATAGLVSTGPSVMLPIATDVDAQLRWLEQQDPAYLLTYPTNAAELARTSLAHGVRLPGLLEVRTFGELLAPAVRESCLRAWGVRVTDLYSANEVGYIALQCPAHQHYHIQSEGVLVEVLDEQGGRCAPGQVGRVVVTALHNFAMPLIRYEIGDYAEVGEACACGRGLPVLRRIVGRVRNMLVTADGKRYWPPLKIGEFTDLAPLLQFQLVQKAYDLIEWRLVTAAPLTADQEARLCERMLSRIPPGIRIIFSYHDRIARSAGGKYEDFISEVDAPARA